MGKKKLKREISRADDLMFPQEWVSGWQDNNAWRVSDSTNTNPFPTGRTVWGSQYPVMDRSMTDYADGRWKEPIEVVYPLEYLLKMSRETPWRRELNELARQGQLVDHEMGAPMAPVI